MTTAVEEAVDIDDCQHEYVEAGICHTCGMSIESKRVEKSDEDFSKNYNRAGVKEDQPKILAKLMSLSFSYDVNDWIIKNYNSNGMVFKSSTIYKLLFAYIYLAHLHLGLTFDHEATSRILDLTKNDVEEAISIASGTCTNHNLNSQTSHIAASVVIVPPYAALEAICEKVGVKDPHLASMKVVMENAMAKDPFLKDERPDNVAIGVFRYYVELLGVKFQPYNAILKVKSSVTKTFLGRIKATQTITVFK